MNDGIFMCLQIVYVDCFQMNMTCTKRKDAVQADVEHTIIRPKILMVYNVITYHLVYSRPNDVYASDKKRGLS